MARAFLKTKNAGGKSKTYRCERCSEPIKPGEKYYEWSFRYGGTHRQHASHGSPKASQLTQSKMSAAYAAIEAAEEDVAKATTADEMASALSSCAEEIDNVYQEYSDSLDNMPDGLRQAAEDGEVGERMQALEEFKAELESKAFDLEGEEFEPESEEKTNSNADAANEWLEDKRQEAVDTLGNYDF